MYGGIEMIKKILLTFLMVMMCGFANADQCFKLSPRAAASALSKDTEIQTKIVAAHRYEIRRNEASNKCHGGKINAESFWKLCSMAGIDIKTQNGKMQCYNKVADLIEHNGTYYRACGKDAAKLGAKAICVNVFKDIQVQVTQGIALAQEYVLKKFNLKGLKCNNERRPADNTDAMKYTNQDFVQCYLPATQTYFEFEFDDLKESEDETIKKDFARGVCILHGKDVYNDNRFRGMDLNHGNAMCIASKSECDGIKKTAEKLGGTAIHASEETNQKLKAEYYPSNGCNIKMSGVIWNHKDLKTAYGIDNFIFCKGGSLQFQNTGGLTDALKTYVSNAAKVQASSVRCDPTFKTYYGAGCNSNGFTTKDDIISCYVGTNQIDFVFDDVNEFSHRYAQGAQQGMDCIISGGTYTGKKCLGLGQQQCETLRQANLKNCPECKAVRWDEKSQICTLPSSETATNIKKGLDITMIAGGAVVGVVVTIATAGKSASPMLAWVLTGIETVGAGIEITAQLKIDSIADKFFVESANCQSESCAKDLVYKYLEDLARIERDLTDTEVDAVDKEMARLIGLIPTNSDWWIDYLKNDDGTSFLEKADDGRWTPAQVWRAVGIGMQFAGVIASVSRWVLVKTGYLEKRLSRTSKILLNSAKTAEKNIVKFDKLSDVDKEWYKLWQEYAPKNQTFDDFKAMTNGNLDEMKQMSKNWTPRSKKPIINAQLDKQEAIAAENLRKKYDTWYDLMEKYNIDALPNDPVELAKIYKEHPDLEQATKNWEYAQSELKKVYDAKLRYDTSNYSTFDPEFAKTFKNQHEIDKLIEEQARLQSLHQEYLTQIREVQGTEKELDLLKKDNDVLKKIQAIPDRIAELKKGLPSQWEVAEKYQLKNLGNVVNERAHQFGEIIKNNPEIQSKMDYDVWYNKLTDPERGDVAQKILDEYAVKTGTPRASVELEVKDGVAGYHTPGLNDVVLNPQSTPYFTEGMLETTAHEHGHMIDDLAPNEGALGEQYQYYTSKIYNNTDDAGYRVALTEQSSYKIGPNVTHEATGVNDPYFAKEYDLEAAKNVETTLDRNISLYTTGASVGGIEAGAAAQVIDVIQNKKDDK